MDLLSLANGIETHLQKECKQVEVLTEYNSDSCSWQFVLDDELTGYVSCEKGAEYLDLPTVTIAVCLGDLADANKEDLLHLFEVNGFFYRTHFTVQKIEESWMLFIGYKVMAESYRPEEFQECIDHILSQYSYYMGDKKD